MQFVELNMNFPEYQIAIENNILLPPFWDIRCATLYMEAKGCTCWEG